MITYRYGADATLGGLDMVLSLTPDQAAVIDNAARLADMLDTVLTGIAARRAVIDPPWSEQLVRDAAGLLVHLQGVLDFEVRRRPQRDASFGRLALALGVPRSTAQSRHAALEDRRPTPAELWVEGTYATEDDPTPRVPGGLHDWDTPWPGYIPLDVTPSLLRPDGLQFAVEDGWAEPHEMPTDVPDWPERQAAALIPFVLDEQGWPLNPNGRTGRTGRNLGKWGENQAADPIVVAGTGAERTVLLIQRGDTGQWAIPGGMVDPGETAPTTLVRELREETNVDLSAVTPRILTRTYVADPRATDHAWVCSTVALFQVLDPVDATAGDDAVHARWWPFTDLDTLEAAIAADGAEIYTAHQPLLSMALKAQR